MYPLAQIPTGKKFRTIKNCLQCKKKISFSKWDAWNGFLSKCPYCGRINGGEWSPKAILWGSFFFNALSFFFTMRWHKALLVISIYVLVGVLGNSLLDRGFLPQPVETVLAILFIFLPLLINGVLIYFHARALNYSTKTRKENVLSLLEEIFSFLT